MQIEAELAADDLQGVPVLFYNAQSDEPGPVREALLEQLNRMRNEVANRLFDLCAAVDDLIRHHEEQAVIAAIEEVARRLATFLDAHGKLGARETLAHNEALNTVRSVRYASTLWASTRRNGEYSGLNIVHQVGVGAARDARLRSARWFASLEDTLATMRQDEGLALAARTIDQIRQGVTTTRTAFLEAVQRAGTEVYYEPLSRSVIWAECAAEWGAGKGFTQRVANRLADWFEDQAELKDRLEGVVNALWDRTVIAPVRRLAKEAAPIPQD
jgi:hypothetical protein